MNTKDKLLQNDLAGSGQQLRMYKTIRKVNAAGRLTGFYFVSVIK